MKRLELNTTVFRNGFMEQLVKDLDVETMKKVFSTVSLILIIIAGIICNLYAIFFINRKKTKTTAKDKIILVLCGSNLYQNVGYSVELHFVMRGTMAEGPCEAAAFIICCSTYTTIACFAALMIERYISIVFPFQYVSWFHNKNVVRLCIFSPIVYGLSFSITPLFGWGKYGMPRPNSTYCGFDFRQKTEADKIYFFVCLFCSFGFPLLLTTVCFAHIIIVLRGISTTFIRRFGRTSHIIQDSNKNIMEQFISLITAIVYISSWIPLAIVCFMYYFQEHVPLHVEYFAIYLAKTCTITSTIVFCLIEKRVRKFKFRREDSSAFLLGTKTVVVTNVDTNQNGGGKESQI